MATLLTWDHIYKELVADQTSTIDHFILIAIHSVIVKVEVAVVVVVAVAVEWKMMKKKMDFQQVDVVVASGVLA